MKIGIVGYQGAGKSSLFHFLTGVPPDPAVAHQSQLATATVVDPRLARLFQIYQPKKITQAALNIVDTPGLNRTHEGSAIRLAQIREVGCLVVVVGAYAGASPSDDLRSFEEDLLLADLGIVSGRVEKLKESVKKPRPNREQELAELQALEPMIPILESGKALRDVSLSAEQTRAIKSFQLFTEKPRFVVINTAEDPADPGIPHPGLDPQLPRATFSIALQLDLHLMSEEDRNAFCAEMEVQPLDRDHLVRQLMEASGQMLFFTAGEKEVRSWMIRRGATAEEAAAGIHTDLAKGFVRAETMSCQDLIRLGSEREVKAQNLLRREARNYVIQEGDVVHILANV
jgi:ribosome-binding ATPase YchF (GTP1/OBG family)